MIAKTSPTACSETTPSRSRAPPECHRPMTGHAVGQRALVGGEDRPRSRPRPSRRPGWWRRSRTPRDGAPSIRPIAGEHARVVLGGDAARACPGRRAPRAGVSGLRGSSAAVDLDGFGGGGGRRVTACDAPEGEGDVVAAEAEGVVERQRASPSGSVARLAADDVEVHVVVGVLEVDRRRRQAVVQREHAWRSPRPRRRRRAGARSSTWSPRRRRRRPRRRAPARIALRLGDVADRRRGRVRVDVHDVARR